MYKWSSLAIISFIIYSCQSSDLTISIDKDHFFFDERKALVLCQTDLTPFKELSQYAKVNINFADEGEWEFVQKPIGLSAASSYTIRHKEQVVDLYFTNFPIIHIQQSIRTIPEDIKEHVELSYIQDTTVIHADIGIERRGETTLNYAKRNYDLEFWVDEKGKKTVDQVLGNLRKDDDWILDAIFNEPLRINAYLAHKLWLKIHTPYYQKDEPKAKSGADVSYVEVFLNDFYKGVYLLSEQVDRKQLKVKKMKGDTIKGELIKGWNYGDAILFRGIKDAPDNKSNIWDGYEFKYPKAKDTIDWSSLHDFTNFVLSSNDQVFKASIENYFQLDNAIDYFIFVNVTGAMDNMAKNIYTARYDTDAPYFYTPWDLDGTWGYNWRGLRMNSKPQIYSNGLYDRLFKLNPADFQQRLQQRWNTLRTGILSSTALKNDIEQAHQLLLSNNAYEKEMAAWKKRYQLLDDELEYMLQTLQERLIFLDDYFKNVN